MPKSRDSVDIKGKSGRIPIGNRFQAEMYKKEEVSVSNRNRYQIKLTPVKKLIMSPNNSPEAGGERS